MLSGIKTSYTNIPISNKAVLITSVVQVKITVFYVRL